MSEVSVTVATLIRSEVGARIAPVVENPSSARKPAAAGFGQVPSAASAVLVNAHAAVGVSLPVAGLRKRSIGSGARPRPGSMLTLVTWGAIWKVVVIAVCSCGKWGSATLNDDAW